MGGKRCSRRGFLKFGAAAALGAVAARTLTAAGANRKSEAGVGKMPALKYRVLGKTGLKVTAVSMGCMYAPEAVIRRAFDLGLNWFDTAWTFGRGRIEWALGRVLKGKRDQAYICTKQPRETAEKMIERFEGSLKRLRTDYADTLLIQSIIEPSEVADEEAMKALQQAKASGKTRFIGVSVHRQVAECIRAALDAGIYDVVLASYHWEQPESVKDAIAAARRAGLGVVAMETQRGGRIAERTEGLTRKQTELKWALDDPNITCAVPPAFTPEELDANIAVMEMIK